MPEITLNDKIQLLKTAQDTGFQAAYDNSEVYLSHEEFEVLNSLGPNDMQSLTESLEKLGTGKVGTQAHFGNIGF